MKPKLAAVSIRVLIGTIAATPTPSAFAAATDFVGGVVAEAKVTDGLRDKCEDAMFDASPAAECSAESSSNDGSRASSSFDGVLGLDDDRFIEVISIQGHASVQIGNDRFESGTALSGIESGFEVVSPTVVEISGSLLDGGSADRCVRFALYGGAGTSIKIRSPGSNVCDQEGAEVGNLVDEHLTLTPGHYTLVAEATVDASDRLENVNASFDITIRAGCSDTDGDGNSDSDGDALCDNWETEGLTVDGQFLDLPAMGADPMHKDIFVEIDYMGSPARRPTDDELALVMEAFDDAPVDNPDGKRGIKLHVDNGPDMPLSIGSTSKWGALSRASEIPFKETFTVNEAHAARAGHFSPERALVFHYAVAANRAPDDKFWGEAHENGSSFVLVLNSSCRGMSPCYVGSFLMATVLMHELGHNLGLDHGGPFSAKSSHGLNHRPNHLSIMNRAFPEGLLRFDPGLPEFPEQIHDYSRYGAPPFFDLDEQSLEEAVGLGADDYEVDFLMTVYRCPDGAERTIEIGKPVEVDWNCNGILDSDPVAVDINGDGVLGFHVPVTEWDALVFNWGGIGGLAEAPPEEFDVVEQTPEEALEAMQALTGDREPPVIRIERDEGIRQVTVTVEDDRQIGGVLIEVDDQQRTIQGERRRSISESATFRRRLAVATADFTGNRPAPVVIECEEDGFGGRGPVSGTVDETVEPLFGGVDPALAALADQLNCEVVDAVEEAAEVAIGGESDGPEAPFRSQEAE